MCWFSTDWARISVRAWSGTGLPDGRKQKHIGSDRKDGYRFRSCSSESVLTSRDGQLSVYLRIRCRKCSFSLTGSIFGRISEKVNGQAALLDHSKEPLPVGKRAIRTGSCDLQVPSAAGERSDGGTYSGSVLQGEIQSAAEVPPPALPAGGTGAKAHVPAAGGEAFLALSFGSMWIHENPFGGGGCSHAHAQCVPVLGVQHRGRSTLHQKADG